MVWLLSPPWSSAVFAHVDITSSFRNETVNKGCRAGDIAKLYCWSQCNDSYTHSLPCFQCYALTAILADWWEGDSQLLLHDQRKLPVQCQLNLLSVMSVIAAIDFTFLASELGTESLQVIGDFHRVRLSNGFINCAIFDYLLHWKIKSNQLIISWLLKDYTRSFE